MIEKMSNIPTNWLLLNRKSTIDTITNKAMVSNIRKLDTPIKLHCNAGSRQVEYITNLNGYERVCYDPRAIANILSLYHSNRKYRVVFEREERNCFRMIFPGR